MIVELRPAVAIPTLEFLQKTFLPDQKSRKTQVLAAIDDGQRRIEQARASVAKHIPSFGEKRPNGITVLTAQDSELQRMAKIAADRQVIEEIRNIRQSVDAIVVPLLKAMSAAADTARLHADRHWDLWSILRRAKGLTTGLANGSLSMSEAMQLRASYATVLGACDPLELARWAQQAIDSADAILADAVARENMTRNNKTFSNQLLSRLLSVPEYATAQDILRRVAVLREEAGTAYAGFGTKFGAASVQRIALGLKHQSFTVDEAGGIRPEVANG